MILARMESPGKFLCLLVMIIILKDAVLSPHAALIGLKKGTLTTTENTPKELKADSTAQTIFLKGHLPIPAIVL